MAQEYPSFLLDQARNPRHHAAMPDATFVGRRANPSCGDVLDIYVKLAADGTVAAMTFDGTGCAVSLAAASLLCEQLRSRAPQEAMKLTASDLVRILGTPISPFRMSCATLPLAAFRHGFTLWQKDSSLNN